MTRAGVELTFHSGARLRRVTLYEVGAGPARLTARQAGQGRSARGEAGASPIDVRTAELLRAPAVADRRPARFLERPIFVGGEPGATTLLIPTETFVIEGGKSAVLQALRRDHGVDVVAEGSHGKMLLRVPGDTPDRVRAAFDLSRKIWKSGAVAAAHPNFVRASLRPRPTPATAATTWSLHNDGSTGVAGADVRAQQAWAITRGSPEVLVAVLDEGIDALHPDLAPAVRRQRDFVDGLAHANPSPHDAHGTAVAGIIASRSERWPGLAPGVSLVSARVARGDGGGHWIADDFDVADAIDWAWSQGAHVITLAWGGGPPVDLIDHALERARRRGRRGKGCVVVAAAGDDEAAVHYPAHVDGVLTVAASNQWDERKTRRSRDGETDWGSNYGPSLDLLAPGVAITTTDNRGATGYTTGDYTPGFNGTAAAAAHVAAAAALVLSAAPRLSDDLVRGALRAGADHLPGQRGWTQQLGTGRLNAFGALRHAKRR